MAALPHPPVIPCEFDDSDGHDHSGCVRCSSGDPSPRLNCGCCVLGCGDCPVCYDEWHSSSIRHDEDICDYWKVDPAHMRELQLKQRGLRLVKRIMLNFTGPREDLCSYKMALKSKACTSSAALSIVDRLTDELEKCLVSPCSPAERCGGGNDSNNNNSTN